MELNKRKIAIRTKDVSPSKGQYEGGRFRHEEIKPSDIALIAQDETASKLAAALLSSQVRQHQFSTFVKNKVLAYEKDSNGNPTDTRVTPPVKGEIKGQVWLDDDGVVRLNWGFEPGGLHESGLTVKQYEAAVKATVDVAKQFGLPTEGEQFDKALAGLIEQKLAEKAQAKAAK